MILNRIAGGIVFDRTKLNGNEISDETVDAPRYLPRVEGCSRRSRFSNYDLLNDVAQASKTMPGLNKQITRGILKNINITRCCY